MPVPLWCSTSRCAAGSTTGRINRALIGGAGHDSRLLLEAALLWSYSRYVVVGAFDQPGVPSISWGLASIASTSSGDGRVEARAPAL